MTVSKKKDKPHMREVLKGQESGLPEYFDRLSEAEKRELNDYINTDVKSGSFRACQKGKRRTS